jgi:glycosyltransferase involved in cell wall biosynthesis
MLCEYASLNGGERSMLALLPGLCNSEFDIAIAAPRVGPLAGAIQSLGLDLVPLALHDAAGHRLDQQECRKRIHDVINSVRPSLVHANSLSMSRLCGPLTADLRIPVLGHLRDIINVNRQVIRDLNNNSQLLAVSAATRQWYLQRGIDRGHCFVQYNGVDLDRFQPRTATGYLHRELGLPDGASFVAAIGQLGMRKGLDVLLEAANHVAAKTVDVHFLIIGQRYSQKEEALEYERQLHELARREPLAGRCHFLGLRDDIPRLLNELTLLVHSARQEPLGRVLLEAAAAGVPVVATDVGGTPEIFPTEDDAILLPSGDASALFKGIMRGLREDDNRPRLARNARQRIADTFSVKRIASQMLTRYRQLLESEIS